MDETRRVTGDIETDGAHGVGAGTAHAVLGRHLEPRRYRVDRDTDGKWTGCDRDGRRERDASLARAEEHAEWRRSTDLHTDVIEDAAPVARCNGPIDR